MLCATNHGNTEKYVYCENLSYYHRTIERIKNSKLTVSSTPGVIAINLLAAGSYTVTGGDGGKLDFIAHVNVIVVGVTAVGLIYGEVLYGIIPV